MAAKDYKICCALWRAYIAKVSKRNPNMMLDDRRAITDREILTLIDWKLENWVSENEDSTGFIFENNEGKKIEVHYIQDCEIKDKERKDGKKLLQGH